MAYKLTRTTGILAKGDFGRARTGTIRRKLIHLSARIASRARKVRLHLPTSWHWQTSWQKLFETLYTPP